MDFESLTDILNVDPPVKRRHILAGSVAALLGYGVSSLFDEAEAKLNIKNHFSQRNIKRAFRPRTDYIILHTTEGRSRGSLKRITKYGLAHYVVDIDGTIYRTIEKNRIAKHAGRSIWNGKRNIDSYSISIEVVGMHNRDITARQYKSLKELIRQLESYYRLSDSNVLTHSMVAYGSPNPFHTQAHRGRKRCGMLFAKRDVRIKLGLSKKPSFDPDVKKKRLAIGDPYLAEVLYGEDELQIQKSMKYLTSNIISDGRTAWSVAREKYNLKDTIYQTPDGRRLRGSDIKRWDKIPRGTKVFVSDYEIPELFEGFKVKGKDGDTAWSLAGKEYDDKTTIYFFPDGLVRIGNQLSQGLLNNLPDNTKVLIGYIYGGHITKGRSAYEVSGNRWNYPSTVYRMPDKQIITGDELDQNHIKRGTLIFFRN
jgi:hypothetical protein